MPQAIFWYAAALAAMALLALMPAHASIEWDFTPTAIVNCGDACTLTGKPVVSLTLDGPDSSGSAIYNGNNPQGTLAGDSFVLSVAGQGMAFGHEQVSTTNPLGFGTLVQFELARPPIAIPAWALQDYSISWSESGGVLDAVLISFDTVQDSIFRLGLAGGRLASDNILGGCGVCDVTGVWNDSSPVSEPGTFSLLAASLAILGLCQRLNARRSRHAG